MLQSHLDDDGLHESWSRILLSDISFPGTVSNPTNLSSSSWKQRVLSCLVEDPEVFKHFPTSSAPARSATTTVVTEPADAKLEMSLDSLCIRERATIPLLVSRAIQVIESNLQRKPMYLYVDVVEERIINLLDPFPATGA